MKNLGQILMYGIVLLAGVLGLAMTTCGGLFMLQGELFGLGLFAFISFGFGAMILVGVYKFVRGRQAPDT